MRVCSVCHRCYENAVNDCIEDGHPILYETRVQDLESIEGYRIERLLNLRSKAETYLARHIASERTCLIRIHKAHGQFREQFLRDAKALASLFHTGVADVYESGELDEREVFIVSEHIEGPTLREILGIAGPPELLTTIVLIRQAAEALHTIHLKGLVHRAVRPENIVVSTDTDGKKMARIQNLDLGGLLENSIISDKFTIDSSIDSLRYFAPEQCSSEPVLPQTDVYGLGIVLFEMLAGHPPFDSLKATGLIEMHRNQRPPDIRIDDFELRMLITHTLTESLNKRPQNRHSSANAFARQLRHMEHLATHVSTPPPAVDVPIPSVKVAAAAAVSGFTQPANSYFEPSTHQVSDPERFAAKEMRAAASEEVHAEKVVHFTNDAEMRCNAEKHEGNVAEQQVHERPSRLKLLRRKIKPQVTAPIEAATACAVPTSQTRVSVPRRIEWETPDDDIPSMEDVVAALSETKPAETAAVTEHQPAAAPEHRTETVPEAPLCIEEAEPVAEIISEVSHVAPKSTVVAAPEQKVIADPKPTTFSNDPKPRQAGRGSTPIIPKTAPAALIGADEITAVTARSKPIRVKLDRPAPRRSAPIRHVMPQPSNDIPFSLTLLGQQRLATSEPSSSFLADYAGLAQAIPLRTTVVGVGLTAAFALFLFSGGAWNRLATLASVEPNSAAAETRESTEPDRPQLPASQGPMKPGKSVGNQPSRPMPLATDVSKPDPTRERSPSALPKAESVASKSPRQAPGPAKEKTVSGFTSGTEKRLVEVKQPPPQKKTDGATRPRIVKLPGS